MENYGFFNAKLVGGEYDRVYSSENFASYFASLVSNGVFGKDSNQLKVVALPEQGMKVKVEPGKAWINGYWYESTEPIILSLSPASGTLNRRDSVIVKLDYNTRKISVELRRGESSTGNPQAPALTRNSDIYELQLATIMIFKGVIQLTQSFVEDKRMNQDVCGIVTGLIHQLDTKSLADQFESYISEFKRNNEESFTQWRQGQTLSFDSWLKQEKEKFTQWYSSNTSNWQSDFISWFNSLKEKLSGNVAANLQKGLDEQKVRIDNLEKEAISKESFNEIKQNYEIMKREIKAPYGFFGIEQNINTLINWVRNGEWDKFAIGDYFTSPTSKGEMLLWEIAAKNIYLRNESGYTKQNNITCISRNCLNNLEQIHFLDTFSGSLSESLLPSALNRIYESLSSTLKMYVTEFYEQDNVYPYKGKMYKVFIPSIRDVFGIEISQISKYPTISNGLPLLEGGTARILRQKTNDSNFCPYWLANKESSKKFYFVNSEGHLTTQSMTEKAAILPLIVLS